VNILETERLTLRQFTADDASFILELVNEPSFIQNIGDRGVRSLADAVKYIEAGPVTSYARNGFGLYLVQLKESGASIGMCGLIKRESLSNVDIGYAFLPKFWSKGYAVEAALAVKEQGRSLGLKRLVAIVDPANISSIRGREKLGFTFEKMIKLSADDIDLKLFAIDL
jgi:[ribosomal protein S5]-alanine N-acetyltransferase